VVIHSSSARLYCLPVGLLVSWRNWLEFEGGVISALFQQSESEGPVCPMASTLFAPHVDVSPLFESRAALPAAHSPVEIFLRNVVPMRRDFLSQFFQRLAIGCSNLLTC
jgi:hypothetical protein